LPKKKRKSASNHSEPGIGCKFLINKFGNVPDGGPIQVGHVLFLFTDNDKSVAKTIRAVAQKLQVPCKIRPHQMKAVTADILKHFAHLSREQEMKDFAAICHGPFTSYSIIHIPDTPEGHNVGSGNEETEMEVDQPVPDVQSSPELHPSKPAFGPSTPYKAVSSPSTPSKSVSGLSTPSELPIPSTPSVCTRSTEKVTPRKLILRKRLDFVSQTKMAMKKRYHRTVKGLRSNLDLQKLTQIKYLKQEIKRKRLMISVRMLSLHS